MRRKVIIPVLFLGIAPAGFLFVLQPWATRNSLNLNSCPQVREVESNNPRNPTRTIVHLRNWHFVTYSQFVIEGMEGYMARLQSLKEKAEGQPEPDPPACRG